MADTAGPPGDPTTGPGAAGGNGGDMTKPERNLEGLGGWLVLVGIGLVFTPLRVLLMVVTTFVPVFSEGHYAVLTDPASEAYHPMWGPLIWFEIVGNLGIIAVAIALLVMFFGKKRRFPMWYIGLAVGSLVFILVDAALATIVLPDEPMIDPDTAKELLRSGIACAIWVPYMLVSKRVKATFVN